MKSKVAVLIALIIMSLPFVFAEDTDGDGVDDIWEVKQFGNLTQKGTDDFDGDGKTNFEEFTTNTNPLVKEKPNFLNISLIVVLAAIFLIVGILVLSKLKKKEKPNKTV